MIDLSVYKTLIFDCDGVILNSNKIKSEAFRKAVKEYGSINANRLVEYNEKHGGVSRKDKIRFFFEQILKIASYQEEEKIVLDKYASIVESELIKCEIATGLDVLRSKYPDIGWYIVSGGDKTEIDEVLNQKGIHSFFKGVYGGPTNKSEIFSMMMDNGELVPPAIYFGDSKYDYISARSKGISFVFVADWTEFSAWESYFASKNVKTIGCLNDLL